MWNQLSQFFNPPSQQSASAGTRAKHSEATRLNQPVTPQNFGSNGEYNLNRPFLGEGRKSWTA